MTTTGSSIRDRLDTLNAEFVSVLLSAFTINIRPQIGRKIFELVLGIAAAIIVSPAAGSFVGMIVKYGGEEK